MPFRHFAVACGFLLAALAVGGRIAAPGLAAAGNALPAGGTLFVGNLSLVVRDHGSPGILRDAAADDGRSA